jgi:hypothetical protein
MISMVCSFMACFDSCDIVSYDGRAGEGILFSRRVVRHNLLQLLFLLLFTKEHHMISMVCSFSGFFATHRDDTPFRGSGPVRNLSVYMRKKSTERECCTKN